MKIKKHYQFAQLTSVGLNKIARDIQILNAHHTRSICPHHKEVKYLYVVESPITLYCNLRSRPNKDGWHSFLLFSITIHTTRQKAGIKQKIEKRQKTP